MFKYNGINVNFGNVSDMFEENVVYKITFPNNQFYIGSTKLLCNRMMNHCSHKNETNSYDSPFHKALRGFDEIKVDVLGKFGTILEARIAEKKYIRKYADMVYSKLGVDLPYRFAVGSVMLNSVLFIGG